MYDSTVRVTVTLILNEMLLLKYNEETNNSYDFITILCLYIRIARDAQSELRVTVAIVVKFEVIRFVEGCKSIDNSVPHGNTGLSAMNFAHKIVPR